MKYLSALFFLLCWGFASAQNYDEIANLKTGEYEDQTPSIMGLWEVELVTVGNEKMTPVARWFHFLANGSQTSGNGGMEHSRGSWRYDAAASTLLTLDQNGKPDEFGPFKTSFTATGMSWERNEEGATVKVSLKRVNEKPLAPWDKINGRWRAISSETENAETNSKTKTDLESYGFYFGWDRRYRKYDSKGKRVEVGIWHIEPHSPWLWLIPYDGEKRGQEIIFDKNGMTFVNKTDESIVKTIFRRE